MGMDKTGRDAKNETRNCFSGQWDLAGIGWPAAPDSMLDFDLVGLGDRFSKCYKTGMADVTGIKVADLNTLF